MRLARYISVAVAAGLVALGTVACTNEENESGSTDVEVFTWWSSGGEAAGLQKLTDVFTTDCADYNFVNAVVAGGAGANAKAVLASRLANNQPPDSFQAHAGLELSDYIAAGQVEDISDLYQEWGLTTAFPAGLVSNLTVDGKIYSVPANIHRANVLWGNKKVLEDAGITQDATTLDGFITDLQKLKDNGIDTPLAVGRDWTQLMLFEVVLISDLGPDAFTGLWTGATSWDSAEVDKSIADYQTLLGYSNADRDNFDWTDAQGLLMNDKAAYQLMGDWEAADFVAKGYADYTYSAFPGNGATFQWLADSFVLPVGAPNSDGAKCWLKVVGSAEGQKGFNVAKGSIPARVDADASDYPAYQQSAMADWKADQQVPSCAHGAACSLGYQDAMNSAMGKFSSDGDVAALKTALVQASGQFAK